MKSRTSFFNKAVLRKDITRFAPAWGLYLTAMLLLSLALFIEEDIYLAQTMGVTLGPLSVVNFGYALVVAALVFRMTGVGLSLAKTKLSPKERLFCAMAYTPKATVQAAIGAIPLSMGLPCGNLVLTVAVLSILITAPFGAICVDKSYEKLLDHENSPS